MPIITAEIQEITQLDNNFIAQMFTLYATYYTSTSKTLFLNDLLQKDHVVLIKDKQDKLVGFSTLKIINDTFQGKPLKVIFSGDTIIEHQYWGEQKLAFTWIKHAGSIKAQAPEVPLYWFLIVKGHRTYRYLHAFVNSYFPNCIESTPKDHQDIMNKLATKMFGDNYQPETGIIHFSQSKGHLLPEWAEVKESEACRDEVDFFLKTNSGYRNGDELVCLTELHHDNLKPLARRLFLKGMAL